MKLAACYIRVSTADQVEYSPESQLRMIKDYANKNNMLITDKYIYRDEGISGRKAEKRPGFQKMILTAKQTPPPFDVILVYSTSRFARNYEESIVYRSMLEKQCKVELISITQPNIDKKTDMLTTAIYSIIDEWYSLDLAENVKRGMTQKALNGETQTAPPLGYDLTHKGAAFSINENEAKAIRFIFDEFLKGSSKWNIARHLNEQGIKTKRGCKFSERNIYYILRNVVYKGYTRWTPTGRVYWDFKNPGTIVVKAKHKPIISEELFDNVQIMLDRIDKAKRPKERPFEEKKHWLSGLIRCASCGASLNYNGVTPTRKNAHFRCGGYGKGLCRDMNFILLSRAEKLVIDYLYKVFNYIDILYEAKIISTDNKTSEISFLNTELKNLEKKLQRAKNGFLNDVFEADEYKKLKAGIEKEQTDIQNRLDGLNKPIAYAEHQKNIKNTYNVLIDAKFCKDDKARALKSIIDNIVYDKKSGRFQINFYY